ncbi:hypothetical protein GWK36_01845 [Caldichromatium japonicum]|uniref:Uncharacterized protein n=1 Tax=Caldichromatium japonicum TaxID=2699430 RepID=A0A6G7VAR8_9GAMM|nr:hypothetical protein [Caldichromatium japonicum]QIK36948.1 hypothetical protein GWK36_01845 [Caldichromatium japonicum]
MARSLYRPLQVAITERMVSRRMSDPETQRYDFERRKNNALSFVSSMQMDDEGIRYRYSADCTQPTLYSSAYACMIYSLLGELQRISQESKARWIAYFDSMQSRQTGLFYDPVVKNKLFDDSDWWGARHLALHMISAYTTLGGRPRYPFYFLRSYKDTNILSTWLDSHDWSACFDHAQDIDNKIMNIGCLLQYQRDHWQDSEAGDAVRFLQDYLLDKMNANTGLWGAYNPNDPVQVSRGVQFAYHLLPIFLYDRRLEFNVNRLLEAALRTQNKYGGFAPTPNSSACEDIDSIYILARLVAYAPQYRERVLMALKKAQAWVVVNQVDDGGFVFRLNEGMTYGHRQMMSRRNRGAMFPTWFRLLSLAYSTNALQDISCLAVHCPGYYC